MNPWQRFARQRLARSRWNRDPAALDPADTPVFEQAWQRQCHMEQTIVARVPEGDIPAALLENIAASLAIWLVRHHARLELAFADIARQAPQPDLSTVQAWYLRHQTQFMRPEQRLTRHLLLTVDNDREAVHQRILGLYRQINASRDAFAPLAQRYSHCPSALEEGRLGWISRGLLYPQLETALFSLAENALSLPIASELGWHLLWCEAIRPAAPMEPQQALESARDYLWQQSQQRHQRQWLEQMISRQPGLCG